MTINETEMATIPTKRFRGFKLSAWTIGLLLVGGAGIAAAVMVQRVTSGTETARTATASLSVDGVEQSRALNNPATTPKAAITTLSLDGVLAARALNKSEAPAASVAKKGIVDARLTGIADARALNAPGGVTTQQRCTSSTIDDC